MNLIRRILLAESEWRELLATLGYGPLPVLVPGDKYPVDGKSDYTGAQAGPIGHAACVRELALLLVGKNAINQGMADFTVKAALGMKPFKPVEQFLVALYGDEGYGMYRDMVPRLLHRAGFGTPEQCYATLTGHTAFPLIRDFMRGINAIGAPLSDRIEWPAAVMFWVSCRVAKAGGLQDAWGRFADLEKEWGDRAPLDEIRHAIEYSEVVGYALCTVLGYTSESELIAAINAALEARYPQVA